MRAMNRWRWGHSGPGLAKLGRCGAKLAGLGLVALLGAACSDADPRPEASVSPGDNPQTVGLRIDETRLRATPTAGGLAVVLPVEPTGRGVARGTATVSLHRLGEEDRLASASAPFRVEGVADLVALTLPVPEDLAALAPSALAAYVLRYHVRWGGAPLWGRRSLFAAAPLAETQLLSSDTFQVGMPAFVRLLARDPHTDEALDALPVRIGFEHGAGDAAIWTTLFEGQTDASGQLAAPLRPGPELVGEGALVVQVETAAGPQELRADVAVQRATKVLVTTDKPLYQPGQTMHLRALALRRPDLAPEVEAAVVWEIFDGKDNKVERLETRTDGFGVTHLRFQLAQEVNEGRYRIVATVGEAVTEKTVSVARYSLPKFDLGLSLDRAVYFAGDRLVGTVRARYFFGEPVAGGAVAVSASALDAGESVFAQVQGVTNGDGLYQFEIEVPRYLVGLPLEQGGGLINLALEVTDAAGQARSLSRLVRVARGALELALVPESGRHVPGVAQRLLLRTTDAAGEPVPAEVALRANGQPLPTVQTNAAGLGSVAVRVADPTLEIEAEIHRGDDTVAASFRFSAEDAPEGAVLVRTDRAMYRVGDTLTLEAVVAGALDRVFLDVIRSGQTVLTEVLRPDQEGRATFSLDLSADHAGPLKLTGYYLAQGSSLQRSSTTVYVDLANDLQVTFETDKPVYAPGESAELTVRVTDAAGRGQVAALGLQGVDEAVYSLLEQRPGLERSYFRIEGELATPQIQVGVPGLNTLVSGGGVDDPRRQAEAALLFAAAGDQASHPVAINSYQQAQVAVQGVIRPALEGILAAFTAPLVSEMQAQGPWDFDVAGWVAQRHQGLFDPWGQPLRASVADRFTVALTSAGPDERAGTADDVTVRQDLIQALGQGELGANPELDDNAPPPQAGGGGAGGGGAGPEGVRVRRDFPETLFVAPALITDAQGVGRLTIPLADSITTWRISALANSAQGLLGSADHGLRVFQDFFVDIDFPAALTRGDEVHVPVAVYNYLEVPQVVTLTVQPSEGFTLLGEAVIRLPLDAGQVAGIRVPVRMERVGLHELLVIAEGDEAADAVARSVRVEPDGQRVEAIASGGLEAVVEHSLTVPADAVEGSGQLFVKLYPGVFSQVIDGLDGLLGMPSGCFEQTSATTWPNVLVARYLDETGAGDPETLARALQYIHTGYQRLLTFEVEGGGFEWFGSPPSHTVLTAYGLLEFTDMAQVRVVDEAMLARTRAWLLAEQKEDGRWETTRGYDESGQLTDPVPVTAYVAFALAAAGERGPALARAQQYLAARVDQLGTYSAALAANFMVHYRPDDPLTRRLLDRLADTVQAALEAEPGRHWQTDEQTTTYGNGEPAAIETTALATHALLVAGAHPPLTEQALAWLVSKKSPSGAWGSTAGTVWTIKCLLASLTGGRDEGANATVRVLLDGQERATFQVTRETSDVMRQADLSPWLVPGRAHTVHVLREGEGRLNYSVILRHHQPWQDAGPAEGPLSITVDYDRTDLERDDTVTATVSIANASLDFADMVMVDLGIPPGFELVRADLDALQAAGTFRRYEATPRQLLLYLDALLPGAPLEFSYRLLARDPIRAQAPRSRIYSYYNPGIGAETEPVDFQVD